MEIKKEKFNVGSVVYSKFHLNEGDVGIISRPGNRIDGKSWFVRVFPYYYGINNDIEFHEVYLGIVAPSFSSPNPKLLLKQVNNLLNVLRGMV